MTGIRVELQLKDGSFTSGMLRAGQTVSQFRNELARVDPHFRKMAAGGKDVVTSVRRADLTSRDFLSTLRDLTIVSAGISMGFRAIIGESNGLFGSIIKVNAEMERLKFQMLGMSTSAQPLQEAAASVDWLRKKALEVPFSLTEMASSFVKLKATGTDPMAGSLQAVADGIAAFGGTDQHLHRVTLGIVQMSGKGVIQMEEMRQQLGESMPNAMRIMARSMGVSVAELTKAISTGRVEAGAALQAFTDELNRTYGGESQRMMETFSGQVMQLKANLQFLATEEDGLKLFFDAQKDALQDLNDFFRSNEAKKFAKEVSTALVTVVESVTWLTKSVYEFREEIALVAKFIAGGIAFKVLGTAAASAVTALNLVRMSAGALGATMLTAASTMKLGAVGLITMQSAGTSLGLTLLGLRTGIVALGSAVMVAAPWLAVIGAALALAGQKMGWFGDKTKDAWENLQRFGAENKAAAEAIIEREGAELRAERDRLANLVQIYSSTRGKEVDPRLTDNLAVAERKLAEFEAKAGEILTDLSEDSADEDARKFSRSLDVRLRDANESYRQQQVIFDKDLDYQLSRTAETGKKQFQITEEYQKKTLENRQKRSSAIIKVIDEEIASIESAILTAEDSEAASLTRILDMLNARRIEEFRQAQSLDNSGIKLVADIESEEAKIKRGAKLLGDLQTTIKGLQADMVGAGDAYARLQFQIARGDYGSVEDGGDAVRELHEALKEATAQKEALDSLMKGDDALNSSIDRLEQDIAERRRRAIEAAAGGDLLEADRLLMRLNSGFFEGLGPLDNIKSDVEEVALSMRENAFGTQTVNRIETVNEALSNTLSLVTGIGNHAANLSLDGLMNAGAMGGIVTPMSKGMKTSAAQILGLLANEGVTGNAAAGIVGNFKAESAFDSGAIGDGGTSFGLAQWHDPKKGQGRWTNLRKFAAENNADEGDPRTQIKFMMHELRTEHSGLLERMNMAANPAEAASMFMREFEIPDMSAKNNFGHEKTRREAAMQAAQIQPANVLIPNTFDAEAMIQNRVDTTAASQARIEEIRQSELDTILMEEMNKQADFLKDLVARKTGATFETEGLGRNFSSAIEAIQTGKLGRDTNIDSELYTEILAAAKELDIVEARVAERRKAIRQSDEQRKDLERERAEIAAKIADEQARIKDPDFVGQSAELKQLVKQLDEYTERVRTAYGAESVEYKAALAERAEMLGQQRTLDVTMRQGALADEVRDIRDGLMTQSGMRDLQMQRDIDRVNAWVEAARAAGMAEVDIVRQAEELKKAVRDKYATETNPVIAQMQEWKDFSGNIMQKTTGWMDNVSSGITGLITGTTSLKEAGSNLVNTMLEELVNAQVKFLTSSLFGDKASSAAGLVGGKGKGGGKIAPIAHTGGIVGPGLRRSTRVSPVAFMDAPRFHTGGIVGAPRLKKDEVPIVAKKKEGIFTEEQMAALAPAGSGVGNIQINAPVTVNASGGTPEQNTDLAKRMSREIEGTMRGVVVDELRKQMRPGNMISKRSR